MFYIKNETLSQLYTNTPSSLPSIPGNTGSGLTELGDGAYSITVTCLTPEKGTKLHFTVYDIAEGIKYGPYSIR